MSYLDTLNPAQKTAVLHTEGPLLIFAGAGSGKTRVLTYRVAHLIDQGIDPYHIIAITFTNKAAKEMRERISHINPMGEHVWVSTFHAACTRILRRDIEAIGYQKGFSIYDAADALRLIKECITELNLSETNYAPRNIQHIISNQKNELVTPEAYEQTTAGYFREANIAEIYTLYQKKLVASNALDFDDIIMQTVRLLKEHEDIRTRYQYRFRYVMVDEYQDTNHAQYELVHLLSGYANNLCVVGDDDQSIYGWRGANIENILRFEHDFSGATVIKLEQNYRSTQNILDAANAVIAQNQHRAAKSLWTENDKGGPMRLYSAVDDRDEGAFVARVIQHERSKGAKNNDFAVLYRTNAQSRSIEDALVVAGIPYRMYGGVRFYDHTEIKDLLAYLKVLNNPADDIALLRIINVPKRGIGTTSIHKIRQFAASCGITLYHALAHADDVPDLKKKAVDVKAFSDFLNECMQVAAEKPVVDLLQYILRQTRFMDTLQDDTPESEERINNVMELLATARQFEKESEDTSLGRFLEEVALVADVDNYQENSNTVSLMTLHSAKGLEFPAVFLVGFEENLFPSIRALQEGTGNELEEERRLCYVGITRAKQRLYITHANQRLRFNEMQRNKPSRFLSDIPQTHITPVDRLGEPVADRQSRIDSMLSNLKATGRIAESPVSVKAKPTDTSRLFNRQPMGKNINDLIAAQKTEEEPAYTDFKVGDKVKMKLYGVGTVLAIDNSGPDETVTINFATVGRKKFLSHMLKVTKEA